MPRVGVASVATGPAADEERMSAVTLDCGADGSRRNGALHVRFLTSLTTRVGRRVSLVVGRYAGNGRDGRLPACPSRLPRQAVRADDRLAVGVTPAPSMECRV